MKSWRINLLLAMALLVAAGCATHRSAVERIPGKGPSKKRAKPASVQTPPPEAKPVRVELSRPAGIKYPPAVGGSLIPIVPWCQLNGFAPPRQVARGLTNTWQFRTPGGTWEVTMETKQARWNGLLLLLGHVPHATNGQPCLHLQDLQSNIEPLLRPPPAFLPPEPLVVLDPGHGGTDHGAPNTPDGRWEKGFTLDWALRLKPLLEARGCRVLLTRAGDVEVTLSERVAMAERARADVFVSLHFNAVANASVSGVETYTITPKDLPSNLTRNNVDDRDTALPNNAHDAENLHLAVAVHRAMVRAGLADRGLRRARFMTVLRGQRRPAILVEGGYLSHDAEGRRIADPAHRQKLAEAVADGLLECR